MSGKWRVEGEHAFSVVGFGWCCPSHVPYGTWKDEFPSVAFEFYAHPFLQKKGLIWCEVELADTWMEKCGHVEFAIVQCTWVSPILCPTYGRMAGWGMTLLTCRRQLLQIVRLSFFNFLGWSVGQFTRKTGIGHQLMRYKEIGIQSMNSYFAWKKMYRQFPSSKGWDICTGKYQQQTCSVECKTFRLLLRYPKLQNTFCFVFLISDSEQR